MGPRTLAAAGAQPYVDRVPARHVALWVAIRLRTRDASGQTSAEYIGVLLVVAAIIGALLLTDPGQAIGDKLSQIVRDIAGSG